MDWNLNWPFCVKTSRLRRFRNVMPPSGCLILEVFQACTCGIMHLLHLISIERSLGISLEELESVGRRTSNILLCLLWADLHKWRMDGWMALVHWHANIQATLIVILKINGKKENTVPLQRGWSQKANYLSDTSVSHTHKEKHPRSVFSHVCVAEPQTYWNNLVWGNLCTCTHAQTQRHNTHKTFIYLISGLIEDSAADSERAACLPPIYQTLHADLVPW